MMKRVYVAGDYSADNVIDVLKNIGKGQRVCADMFRFGLYPFCPWFDKEFVISNPYDYFTVKQFHKASMAWLEVSDAVFVISGEGNGGGVDAEIKRAKELNIPVIRTVKQLLIWAGL